MHALFTLFAYVMCTLHIYRAPRTILSWLLLLRAHFSCFVFCLLEIYLIFLRVAFFAKELVWGHIYNFLTLWRFFFVSHDSLYIHVCSQRYCYCFFSSLRFVHHLERTMQFLCYYIRHWTSRRYIKWKRIRKRTIVTHLKYALHVINSCIRNPLKWLNKINNNNLSKHVEICVIQNANGVIAKIEENNCSKGRNSNSSESLTRATHQTILLSLNRKNNDIANRSCSE